jgi:hypothetical protein
MKYCEFCNRAYPKQADYCATCGNRLVEGVKCPDCNTNLDIGYRHCPQCGRNIQDIFDGASRIEMGFQANSILQQERDQLLRTNLTKLLIQGRGGFVIFEENTRGFFVQFAQDGNTLRLDHPKPHISTLFTNDHATKLRTLLDQELIEIFEGEDSIAADVGGNVDFIIYLTDTIFKHVFGLDATYEITVELSLDGEVADVIGN